MPDDPTVDLVRALAQAMDGTSLAEEGPGTECAWESMAMILEFGEGYRSAHGYAYPPGGGVVAVACRWPSIEAAVDAYLASHYEPGDRLPVKILVQLDRTTGRYRVTFEDTDEDRWAVTPRNYRTMREELRPTFD
ncbi:hypothetical protein GC722_09580 [Auraticoccus sp. F435]|uniref:Uncharacterized protein n=1 Tax=Auraticoccus cholistanensis TaxID=2656650 RepID=A0A6A9UXI4_9ACTN|nr:hypothetical protein [Auraticoccus cholistanensis]MVA76274.1 hypothetical protein [Auraticoccus cholistanensis]